MRDAIFAPGNANPAICVSPLFCVDFSSDGAGVSLPAVQESESREGEGAAVGQQRFFLSGYFGLATSMYPYAIPPTVTLYEAAAQPETVRFPCGEP